MDVFPPYDEQDSSESNVPIPSTTTPQNKPVVPDTLPETKQNKHLNEVNCKNVYICDKFSVMHSNVQSINGRLESLQAIVDSLKVDIVTVNETNLKGNKKFTLEGFKTFNRNRKEGNMGGIATAIREKHSTDTLKVTEGKTEEYIITRHGQFDPTINVINLYGSQES